MKLEGKSHDGKGDTVEGTEDSWLDIISFYYFSAVYSALFKSNSSSAQLPVRAE